MKATAIAHPNFALIKYWGKADRTLNIPATGSISVTVDRLLTKTEVSFDNALDQDIVTLDGNQLDPKEAARVVAFMDLVRKMSGCRWFARVNSINNFPADAGLASSASAFAALALAASNAAGLKMKPGELSALARRGSGSAARSIFGGYVEMHAGTSPNGLDAIANPIAEASSWPLVILIAVTSSDVKRINSTDGMNMTAKTSPFFNSWITSTQKDLENMRAGIGARDLARVGELMEHSCLKMHGLMLSARPGLIYWNDGTLQVIETIRRLRRQRQNAYFTVDAGPQVKVICEPDHLLRVKEALSRLSGVSRIIETMPGPAARLLED